MRRNFSLKIAGVNIYGLREKRSLPVTDVRSIHWMIGTKNWRSGLVIKRWARGANAAGYSFNPEGGLSRSRSVDLLFLVVKNARQLLPSVVNVTVQYGLPRDVIVFDFVPQLLCLLQNPKLMTSTNLLIDPKNPLLPYTSPDGVLGDALSGRVY